MYMKWAKRPRSLLDYYTEFAIMNELYFKF